MSPGGGRDSREHEQFAAHHGAEIEAEFQRRAAEQQQPNKSQAAPTAQASEPKRLTDGTLVLTVDAERYDKFVKWVRTIPLAEPPHEPEPETDRYGNEIIDMSGPVELEPSHEEPPPLEPDSYVPDRQPPPPEHDLDFEMGD